METNLFVAVAVTRAVLPVMRAQRGDPAKAVHAIALAIESNPTPLRLQLGAGSIATVRTHAQQLLSELAAWERVGAETAVERAAGLQELLNELPLARGKSHRERRLPNTEAHSLWQHDEIG